MGSEQSSAAVAAQRVQAIVEAAEAAAREIEEKARADAAAHVANAKDAIDGLVAQADLVQARLDEITMALGEVKVAVDAMAAEASALASAPAREAEPVVAAEPVAAAEPDAGAEPASPEVGPIVPEAPEPAPEVVEESKAQVHAGGGDRGRADEGARLVALNMALSGTPREETARYLRENFAVEDEEELLDDVYARAGS
jgi:hypothetical protein